MVLFQRFLIAAFALVFSAASLAAEFVRGDPEQLGLSAERLAVLDARLKSFVEEDRIAGQVVLVLRDGKVAFSAANGWRDKEAGAAMSGDTIFRIASQTKAIVSTAIMVLQEQGKLDISDPLGRYIPEWSDMRVAVVPDGSVGYVLEDAARPITIRHLLTHTAGMSYGGGPAQDRWEAAGFQGWYFANRDEPIAETIARMGSLPLDAHPGEQWIYGYSTDILGVVVEKASGMDLQSFLQQHIFDPLDMRDTHFYLPEDKRDRLATVYRPGADGVEAIPETDGMQSQGMYVDGPRTSFSGGAGLLSTARDYARFLQMTLNGGELDGARILSPKTVELMTVDHLAGISFRNGQGFGLGYYVLEDLGANGRLGTEGEYGWGGAYHSTYWVDPAEDLVVVYLTQIIPATGLNDYNVLRNGIYQAIVD